MTAAVPRIIIPPDGRASADSPAADRDPYLAFFNLLRIPNRKLRALDLVQLLIDEGRSFAKTPSGRRWAVLLSQSSLVESGWLFWNRTNLDLLLRAGDKSQDTPSVMLEEVLRLLALDDLEHYITVLGALLAEDVVTHTQLEGANGREG